MSFYGWVRGAAIEASFSNPLIRIVGVGHYTISKCSCQPDPCPTPEQLLQSSSSIDEAVKAKMKKRLTEGDRKAHRFVIIVSSLDC